MSGRKKKAARAKKEPTSSKIPRQEIVAQNYDLEKPKWLFSALDLAGPFGWERLNKKVFISDVLPKLQNFETMTWQEIMKGRNHSVPQDRLSPEAQKRLVALSMHDIDNLFSMTIKGKPRVWGIRTEGSLKLLWWDPDHKVCLSYLKNT